MIALYISLGIVFAAAVIVITVILLPKRYKEYKYDKADQFLLDEFGRCNVLVCGPKRYGKDLIFAHVIALRGEKHYANIPYDENTVVINLSDLNVGENTFTDFINGTLKPFKPQFEEGLDFWISDGGIYLPCHFNRELNEKYPGMPVFFALCGQLYNANVHLNSQAFGRSWDKLREQADSFIRVERREFIDGLFYVPIIVYSKLSDAENETNPIAKYTVRIPLNELKYDTRYFRELLFESTPIERDEILSYILRS